MGKLLLAASGAITAALVKMELDMTLINRSSGISPEKSAWRLESAAAQPRQSASPSAFIVT